MGWGCVAGLSAMASLSNSYAQKSLQESVCGTAVGGCCLSLPRGKFLTVDNKLYGLKHESGK